MISVPNESVRSQPDFRCPFDCRLSDVLAAGSASSSHLRNNCVCVAGSNFDLETVPRQSGEIIRGECNGDFSPAIVLFECDRRVVLSCANATHVRARGRGTPYPRQVTDRQAGHMPIAGNTAEF
jgi:hypothetical protein